MTDYCKIGPISIHNPHLVDGDSYKTTEEEFEVYCTHWQFKQLLSLIDDKFGSQGTMGATILNGENPWSPVYIDTSTIITDNDYLKHKGWYIVTNVETVEIHGNKYLKAKISVTKVSALQNEMLTMDYTTGANDGTQKDSTYDNTDLLTLLSDSFTSFDTTNTWTEAANNGMTGASITASGGSLVFSGASSANGTFKSVWTQTQDPIDGPMTIDTYLTWTSRPASGAKPHLLRFIITPEIFDTPLFKDAVYVSMWVSSTATYFKASSINKSGVVTPLVNITSNNTTYHLTVGVNGDKSISIYLDGVLKYKGPSNLSTINNLYPAYMFYNQSTTSKSMSTSSITITRSRTLVNNNIVTLPAGSTPMIASDFTRASSEGNIPCYVNPKVPLPFVCTDPYLGSVKAYTNNNPDNTYRRMLSLDEIPTATGFCVSNGLVKLVTTSTGVTFQYWNGTAWATLNTFNIGTLAYLKLIDIGPESVTFQANTTKWTLRSGVPFVTVKHPNDDLDYTLKDTYDHDGTTTTNPSANASISMTSTSYAEIYNSTDTYGMQIYKLDPCTIKSDSIPASPETGIGVYDISKDGTDWNSSYLLPVEYPIQTSQHISIKQV